MTYGTEPPTDVNRLLEELTARALADQAAATQRYRDLLERVGTGEIDPVRLRAEYNALVQEQSARMMQDLTTLGADYYRAILDLNRRYVEHLLDALGAGPPDHHGNGSDAASAAAPAAEPRARGELALRAPVGSAATGSFVVENPDVEPATVTFFVSDVTNDDGVVSGGVAVSPSRVWLVSGGEEEVVVRVDLDRERFVPGTRYHAAVLARGAREFEVELTIDVDPPVADV